MTDENTILLQGQLQDFEEIACKLIRYAREKRVWLFNGGMGVGKTTLIKSICKQLNVIDIVTSPTFSLVNEYICTTGEKIYHFDCYRISGEKDLSRIDFEYYFDTKNYCFIEWPSKIDPIIPDTRFCIEVTENTNGSRNFEISP